MSILTRKPVAVEALAANLSAAQNKRNEVVAQANSDYESARLDVIEQGVQRAQDLRALEAETAAEAARAEKLVADARKL